MQIILALYYYSIQIIKLHIIYFGTLISYMFSIIAFRSVLATH